MSNIGGGGVVPVSVVIPCYRCTDTIGRAVASVAAQTARPSEVILVDDCSGDETLEMLRRLQGEYAEGWIRVIAQERNAGPGEARNAGWDQATQPFIAFLDSDDSWHPRKIEVQYGEMSRNEEIALSGHPFVVIGDGALPSAVDIPVRAEFQRISQRNILVSNPFSTPSVMLRAELPQRFPTGGRYCEDYHLWTEILFSGAGCFLGDVPLVNLHKAGYGESGLSAELWKMEKGELGVYRNLRTKRYLGAIEYTACCCFSLAKFIVRWIRVSIRK